MSQIKCKMCGGDLRIVAGSSVAECEYCGTRQTLPKLDDERKANLYDRASHFRRLNDYDKAQSIYEQILAEDKTDAELYWSLVLCRYGVEYVEDPRTHKRIPTINRTQFNSILNDEDYLSALRYADAAQKEIFESEAKRIDQVQKGILSISKSEKPYDVFICYKETDEHGRRTIDSVLAQDLYKELTNEGFKVFFSRITLENQLGTAYEPYIFAALNSAKVMVVVGTKPEHFNAVWVKNEWSRYLSLMRNGEHKTLIPAYRDMNPYDLPEEFSYLQGQDMSKIGFMQDLLRGIKKVVNGGIPEEKSQKNYSQSPNQENSAVAPLLRRAEIFWEEGNAARATEYLNRVLDMDPENGRAYLQLLLIDFNAKSLDDLFEQNESIESNINYQRIMRYAGDEVKDELYSSRKKIISKHNDAIYNEALKKMQSEDVALIEKAMKEFKAIPSWCDANQLAEQCAELLISIPKDRVYTTALKLMEKKDISSLEQAAKELDSIAEWKDSVEKAKECRTLIQEIKNTVIYEEASKLMEGNDILNLKKAAVLFASIPGWKEADQLAEYCNNLVKSIPLDKSYLKARQLMKKGDVRSLKQAAATFQSIADWKDSAELYQQCQDKLAELKVKSTEDSAKHKTSFLRVLKVSVVAAVLLMLAALTPVAINFVEPKIAEYKYNKALTLIGKGQYEEGYEILLNGEYSDAEDIINQDKYDRAIDLSAEKQYDEAALLFTELANFSDAEEQLTQMRTNQATELMDAGNEDAALAVLKLMGDAKIEGSANDRLRLLQMNSCIEQNDLEKAKEYLELITDEATRKEAEKEINYLQAKSDMDDKEYQSAYFSFENLNDYKDSAELYKEARYLYGQEQLLDGQYASAESVFNLLEDYKDSDQKENEARSLFKQKGISIPNTYITYPFGYKSNDVQIHSIVVKLSQDETYYTLLIDCTLASEMNLIAYKEGTTYRPIFDEIVSSGRKIYSINYPISSRVGQIHIGFNRTNGIQVQDIEISEIIFYN